jgi:Flp pilus assembly protein TadG
MSRTFTFANTATHCPGGRRVANLGLLRGEEGAALLEYALIFILFMMLLFGIMGMGQMLYSYHFVSSVARDATRWAAVNGATCGTALGGDSSCNGTAPMNSGPASESDIQTYVTNHTPLGIQSSQITTTPTWPVQAGGPTICSAGVTGLSAVAVKNYPGCTVEVEVSYNYTFTFPLISTKSLKLSSTSEMIIAH